LKLLILQQRKTAKKQVKMLSLLLPLVVRASPLFDNPLLPQNYKPVMLDDTCYFIGFDKIEYAIYTLILLNSDKTEEFLKSITFYDAKRVFTKDILMRLNLLELAIKISQKEIKEQIDFINAKYDLEIKLSNWDSFIDEMKPKKEKQLKLF